MVVGVLVGAQETKVRPAVVIASATYLAERPDVLAGILTTKLPQAPGATDYILRDWRSAGLRAWKIDVWGTSLPFTNAVLQTPYVFQQVQGQYVVNHFRWLLERPLLDIEPKKTVVKPLEMTGPALDQLWWVINVGFPAFGVALGLLAWFLRRK